MLLPPSQGSSMSLRLRLTLLVVISMLLSSGLVLWLSWEQIGKEMLSEKVRSLSALMQQEEERLLDSVENYLSRKVQIVLERKAYMRTATERTLQLVTSLRSMQEGSDTERLLAELRKHAPLFQGTDAISMPLASGQRPPLDMELVRVPDLLAGKPARLGLQAGFRDLKQQSVADLLDSLPDSGQFLVLNLPGENTVPLPGTGGTILPAQNLAGKNSMLCLLMPVRSERNGPPGELLVSTLSLRDLEDQSLQFRQKLLLETYERYLDFATDLFGASILDSKGTLLATTMHSPNPVPDELRKTLRARGEKARFFTQILPGTEQGDLLCAIRYIDCLDWIVLMQVPLDNVTRAVDTLFTKFACLSLFLILAALGISVSFLVRTLRPLELLTRKSRRIAALDFHAPHALERIRSIAERSVDMERRDELGELSRAYATMGHALADNISMLMKETADRERLNSELKAAREIQMGMLPPAADLDRLCSHEACACLCPARAVGGDLYDAFELMDGRIAFIIGDVSGKGMPAALFMSMTVTLLRCVLENEPDAAVAMTRVNNLIEAHNPGTMFVSLLIVLHDPQTGDLAYVNGGHCVPCVRSLDGSVRSLEGLSGPVVGAMPNLRYQRFEGRLEPGELLVLYTDGVTEARDEKGAFFGLQGLKQTLAHLQDTEPARALQDIVQAVQAFAGTAPQHDDITLLVLRRPESAAPGRDQKLHDTTCGTAAAVTERARERGTDKS